MFCHFNLRSVSLTFGICVFVIITVYQYLYNVNSCPMPETITSYSNDYSKKNPQTFIDSILEMTRISVKIDMWNYNYSHSGVDRLEDLVIESGGHPIRSIVVSTWRSGSSFLGDVINSVPGSFYTFEPFMMYGILQIRGPPLADKAIRFLKTMLKCDFNKNLTDFVKYFTYAKRKSKWLKQFNRNERVWNMCNFKRELCYDAEFNSKMCKLFPFQTVKLDRLRLPVVKSILEDDKLSVKVILLVRDPRGVMQSRRQIKNFCSSKNIPDCADTTSLCSDMIIDYKAAAIFLNKYPQNLMVLRYEDFAMNLEDSTLSLLKFLRLEPTESVHEFLQKHTKTTNPHPYSTFRVTKNIPFKWRKTMTFDAVEKIQDVCKDAMSLWGYKLVQNASQLASKNFNPLLPYYVKQNE